MNSTDRGTKHVCPECQCKYYDLKSAVIVCPKCGAKPLPAKVRKTPNHPKDAGRTKVWRYP
jgi:uncharacterized protein (TIGR02300 family)